jgi:hypothetical protein
LIYIWATPEDILDLRSTYRNNEALYRYRTAVGKKQSKELFLDLISRTDQISRQPEFYQTIRGNCTTELLPFLKKAYPGLNYDHRALINGTIDRMLFEQGFLEHNPGEQFDFLRARSLVHPQKKKKIL